MISFLRGKILNKGAGFIIIEVNNIGYKVFVNTSLFADLGINKEAAIYTHQYVREDAVNLYGFKNMEELAMFEMLLSVSGIGPKTALGVLAVGSIADIRHSIAHGDSNLLTKVSGIGKKTAERVVLELREKVSALDTGASSGSAGSNSTAASMEIDALMALGYNLSEAREVLSKVDPKIKDSGERIKQALKMIGK